MGGVLSWIVIVAQESLRLRYTIVLTMRSTPRPSYMNSAFVFQHVKGHLRDKRGKRLWRGIDHTETDYSDQPWEMEALKMEDVLYKHLTDSRNHVE